MSAVNITDLATSLNNLLQTKEKELKEKEDEFERRVAIFEKENPMMGNDTDIIQLNVGGTTNIAVHRRTLTQFKDSMLASQFSGRWDDSMEKDRDGNIFVDQKASNFNKLLDILRMRMNSSTRKVPDKQLPTPSYSFCSMLEYYGLMPAVYPQSWKGETFSSKEIAYGTVVLTTDTDTDACVVVHDSFFNKFCVAGVLEFTVEFDQGSAGVVGWIDSISISKDSLNEVVDNCLFLNIGERKVFGPSDILEENLMIDHTADATKITCRYVGNEKYSIEVTDASSDAPIVTTEATLTKQRYRSFPMISFFGKVTVSGFKYAIDEL